MASRKKKDTDAAAAANSGATGRQPTTSSTTRPGTTPLALTQRHEALLSMGPGGSSTLSRLTAPDDASAPLPLTSRTSTGGTRTHQQETTKQEDSDQSAEDEGEEVQDEAGVPRASRRSSTTNDQNQLAAILQQMQSQAKQHMEFMRQQMQLSRDEQAEERRREREANEARLRAMEERFAVLAVPPLTVTGNGQTDTTAQEEKSQGSPNGAQNPPPVKDAIPQTPARVSTPASRLPLQAERPVPEDDGDDGDDDDGSSGPPPNARKGLRSGEEAMTQMVMAMAQQNAIPLPAVGQLNQAELIQNGKVFLRWKREIVDLIETAEFNKGGGPFLYETRFFLARRTMDEGVREFLLAYENEAEAGRGEKIKTWDQLILVLEKHYTPARDAEEAAQEFYKTKMTADETMEMFVHRIGAIINRIAKEDLPSNTATEVVLMMIDDKKFPETLRVLRKEQRELKLAQGGRGMEFLTLRNKLPELARTEPNRAILAGLEAWKADFMKQVQKNNGGAKTSAASRVNAVSQWTSISSSSDEELKAKGWSAEKIKALREGACFKCFKKDHLSAACPNKKPTPVLAKKDFP
jgi:TolA-binding protein